jgi:hypothetical protein
MASDIAGWDEQDQSEVFDEENLNEDGESTEFKTLEEIPDVYDVTQRRGDAEGEEEAEASEADFDLSSVEAEEGEDRDAIVDRDAYAETDEADMVDPDVEDGVQVRANDEVDLEFQPDVDGRKGAQGSAGHFESRGELQNDVLRDLGYAKEDKEDKEDKAG